MPILYKINILESLKEQGINTTDIKKKRIFSDEIVQAFRTGRIVKAENLSKVCSILKCRIDELLVYYPEDIDQEKIPPQYSLFVLRSENKAFSQAVQCIYYNLADMESVDNNTLMYLRAFYNYITINNLSLDNMPYEKIDNVIDNYGKTVPNPQYNVYATIGLEEISSMFKTLISKYGNTISTFLNDFFDTVDNYYKEIQ